MFKIVKIILIFIIFFYFLRTFTHNIFPTIEGMCMDGDTELGSSITKDECGEGGFTWKEPGSDDDAGDDAAAGDDSDTKEKVESSQNLNISARVETDASRMRRFEEETKKEQQGKNVAFGSFALSCCCYCCCCCCCLFIFFMPMLIPKR